MPREEIELEPEEGLLLIFQSTLWIYSSNFFLYVFCFGVLLIAFQHILNSIGLKWNDTFALPLLIVFLAILETLRRNTYYYVTNHRIIRSLSLPFWKSRKSFNYRDFYDVCSFTKLGKIFGYTNIILMRKGLINFFNNARIPAVSLRTRDKVIMVAKHNMK